MIQALYYNYFSRRLAPSLKLATFDQIISNTLQAVKSAFVSYYLDSPELNCRYYLTIFFPVVL